VAAGAAGLRGPRGGLVGVYARVLREWLEVLAGRGVGLFDSRGRLRQAVGAYSEYRGSGPAGQRFAGSTWNRHVSVLSVFTGERSLKGTPRRSRSLVSISGDDIDAVNKKREILADVQAKPKS
jgi:hypothetical protein